jgi:hypothetical protein
MTPNEINWLLFCLLVLVALVQASAALVMLWTACDNRPPRKKSFRKALTIALTATVAGAILYVVLGARIGTIDFNGPPRGRLAIASEQHEQRICRIIWGGF